jgi:hypothetical protein
LKQKGNNVNVKELVKSLEMNDLAPIHFVLPTGVPIPAHYHLTEVGRVDKKFIDCGGTRRDSTSCLLQLWTADDLNHRLTAGKLSKIVKLAKPILESEDLPIEVEYGPEVASQYVLATLKESVEGFVAILEAKQTDCLAKDRCGVSETKSCCGGTGCC